ncbi:Low molecular weight phosphotyrosine protein phosphatase [Coemansia sp. RSA 2131]|nr:Low molecular weight phosphotyrosine protein phosphatase [Coemansia sp. RSA 2131]
MDNPKIRVLFVCLGNICRSPMAEAVFAHMVQHRGLSDMFTIDSAGTAGYHEGAKPDRRSTATCAAHNVPVNHRARRIRKSDFSQFDHILCMDESNYEDLVRMQPAASTAQVALFGSYSKTPGDLIIEDPYYGGDDGFRTNFDQVTRCSEGLLTKLGFCLSDRLARE